jgi:hypothetical protein
VKVPKPTKTAKNSSGKTGGETKQRSAYGRYLDAIFLPTSEGEYSSEAITEMQHAMLDLLRSEEPMPEEMRRHLSLAFESLCAGVEYDLVTPVRRPGGRVAPILKATQEAGIRYLRWCVKNKIQDTAPTSTVATAYGVGTRAVRYWYKEWGTKATPALRRGLRARHVVSFMEISGKAYQRFKASSKPKRKT